LNHRLAQGTYSYREDFIYSGVGGGLDSVVLQESPQPTCHLLELLAGAHRAGPQRSLAALEAQLHYPLQRGLKCLTDRPAVLLQGGPVNLSLLVVVPVAKKLLLQAQQFRSEFSAGARTFGDGCQVAY
jgi:hypothetical protein